MRALKTILIILLALAALVVLLGLMGPKDFRVERSTVINAPASAVYANVSSLAAMDKWGPWKEMEHNMTAQMSGSPDGQVGAISHWKSDESEGEQELKELVPNKSVRTELRFLTPWPATNMGTFDIEEKGDSAKVTWGIQGQNDFIGRVMGVFMNMDEMIGPMFEKGLSNLKDLTEKEAAVQNAEQDRLVDGFEIGISDRPAIAYYGTRKTVKWSELEAFFGKNFGAAFGAAKAAGVEPGTPSGIFFDWNEKDKTADLLAGVPVPADSKEKLKGMTWYETPASKAYTIDYYGSYEGTGKAHEAMDKKLKADGVEMNMNVIEEYVTDPSTEPDTSKWLTKVVYLVK